MKQFMIVCRLLWNYFFNPNFRGGSHNSSALSDFIFILNISIIYNFICGAWIRLYNLQLYRLSVATKLSRYMIQRGFLFGGLRFLRPEEKNLFADAVIQKSLPAYSSDTTASDAEIIQKLKHVGYANLGQFFDDGVCAELRDYFCKSLGYASQVPLQSSGKLELFDFENLSKRKDTRYFCFPDETTLKCDPIRTLLLDGHFQSIADNYLKIRSQLYSVNTFMSLSGPGDHYVMRLHRDYDDFYALAFFIYWNDASRDNASTLYIPGSHVTSKANLLNCEYLEGKAGTIFALDSFGLHAGNKSVDRLRLVTWIRYGMIPNLATIQDKITFFDLNKI